MNPEVRTIEVPIPVALVVIIGAVTIAEVTLDSASWWATIIVVSLLATAGFGVWTLWRVKRPKSGR